MSTIENLAIRPTPGHSDKLDEIARQTSWEMQRQSDRAPHVGEMAGRRHFNGLPTDIGFLNAEQIARGMCRDCSKDAQVEKAMELSALTIAAVALTKRTGARLSVGKIAFTLQIRDEGPCLILEANFEWLGGTVP